MALANKDHKTNDTTTTMAIIQASAFYDHNVEEPRLVHASISHRPESPEKDRGPTENFTLSNSSLMSYNGSLLSFEQNRPRDLYTKVIDNEYEYPNWEEDLYPNSYNGELINSNCNITTNHDVPETSGSGLAALYGGPSKSKRRFTGESDQAVKKQRVVDSNDFSSKKAKSKNIESTSKDPQSIVAKNRRERISERLKVLQELVPNGSKVDMVTMLEKAISYVQFLQLQVKVLATDEFWPAQGEKAPDLTQVKKAIDAILASQRDQNSSSK